MKYFIAIQQITDKVLDAEHPSDLHVIGVTYDAVKRTAEVNGRKGYIGNWLVQYQDGSLGFAQYETDAEQRAHDLAEEEIEDCILDGNSDPLRFAYPHEAAHAVRLSAEVARLKDEIDRQDKEIEAKDAKIATLQGVIDQVRGALLMLKGWDMLSLLSDGRGAVTDDAPWAQKLIADTLALLPPTGGES
jgi:hypothetical protein